MRCRTAAEVAEAIRTMVVRGAPAIGVAAAYGYRARGRERRGPRRRGRRAPRVAADGGQPGLGARRDARRPVVRARARDPRATRSRAAARWRRTPRGCFGPGTRALTHCNAGGLATGGYGSAVGALLSGLGARPARARVGRRDAAAAAGRAAHRVGARDGCDPARGDRRLGCGFADGGAARSTCVVTGADRIAANGDTANKIGTYSLAVLARHHGIPFYIVAPTSTVDLATPRRRGDPDRGARPGRGHRALRRAQPRVRRHARGADRRDRHRGGRAPRAVCGVARRGSRARVKALVLAAGYATRLRPLTDAWARSCCRSAAGRSSTGSSTRSPTSAAIDEVHVVTNSRLGAARSREWAAARDGDVVVHDDGTSSNDDRLGAIGDMRFVDRTAPAATTTCS